MVGVCSFSISESQIWAFICQSKEVLEKRQEPWMASVAAPFQLGMKVSGDARGLLQLPEQSVPLLLLQDPVRRCRSASTSPRSTSERFPLPRQDSHLWLAPWLWELCALCSSSSSLQRSSSSCCSVSGACCCLLTRMSSCRSASFSRTSCRKSRSRSASARPDQLSLSSCASWCWMLCTLRKRRRKSQTLVLFGVVVFRTDRWILLF